MGRERERRGEEGGEGVSRERGWNGESKSYRFCFSYSAHLSFISQIIYSRVVRICRVRLKIPQPFLCIDNHFICTYH